MANAFRVAEHLVEGFAVLMSASDCSGFERSEGNDDDRAQVVASMELLDTVLAPPATESAVRAAARSTSVDMILFDQLLARLEWTLVDFRRVELPPTRSLELARGRVGFHHVVSGSIEVLGAAEPVTLGTGALLLLPRAGAYRMRALEHSVVATGELVLSSPAGDSLVEALPDALVACCFLAREPHLASLMEGLASEYSGMRAGASVIGSRLATIIASAAVRAWVEDGSAPDHWLVAVEDPHIARAIAAMNDDPGSPWTVESLAHIARASRSAFAERFHEVVGDPPARYLARIRMDRAKELLRREQLSVAETALRLGYGSEAAFSRAFRRYTGASPALWRRTALLTAGA
ncbi:AraC family transcriptional regulator [Glaciihabitans sp. UYNi722]|uniref:AraC family transcriptional regulator n=1 Tax=Glaciihabitans sp. UYNi722 TaxID=3156344 RepID=UPI003393057F